MLGGISSLQLRVQLTVRQPNRHQQLPRPTDHYFVPREIVGLALGLRTFAFSLASLLSGSFVRFQAKFQLEADGVPGEDITISGIPHSRHVHPD